MYVCDSADRFYAVAKSLAGAMEFVTRSSSTILFSPVVACYGCLVRNQRARRVLSQCLPTSLQEDPMIDPVLLRLPLVLRNVLAEDQETRRVLATFLQDVKMEQGRDWHDLSPRKREPPTRLWPL